MMKILVVLVILTQQVTAQRRLILGPSFAVPNNVLGFTASYGIGATSKYDRFITKQLALTFSVDYVSFGKVYYLSPGAPHVDTSVKMQSLAEQLGAKFFFQKSERGFYVAAEAGLHTSWVKYYDLGKQYYSIDQTNFGYRFGIGLSKRRLDYGLLWQRFYQRDNEIAGAVNSYSINNPLRYLSFRIAYIFRD